MQRHAFGQELYRLSKDLAGCYTPDGTQMPEAANILRGSLENWLNLYLKYYQNPPRGLDVEGWKGHMDSVSGQIARLQKSVAARDEAKGHEQLLQLQRTLGGFTGRTSRSEPGGAGHMLHVLDTLTYIQGDGAEARRERLARASVLEAYHEDWVDRCGPRCDDAPAIQAVPAAIEKYREDIVHEDPVRRSAALPALREAVEAAQAERVAMNQPPAPVAEGATPPSPATPGGAG